MKNYVASIVIGILVMSIRSDAISVICIVPVVCGVIIMLLLSIMTSSPASVVVRYTSLSFSLSANCSFRFILIGCLFTAWNILVFPVHIGAVLSPSVGIAGFAIRFGCVYPPVSPISRIAFVAVLSRQVSIVFLSGCACCGTVVVCILVISISVG